MLGVGVKLFIDSGGCNGCGGESCNLCNFIVFIFHFFLFKFILEWGGGGGGEAPRGGRTRGFVGILCVPPRGASPFVAMHWMETKKTVGSSIFVDLFLRCTIDIYLKDPCEEKITGPKL